MQTLANRESRPATRPTPRRPSGMSRSTEPFAEGSSARRGEARRGGLSRVGVGVGVGVGARSEEQTTARVLERGTWLVY